MKIVVLEGSPNRKGSTHLLIESFANGAKEAGNSIQIIDAAHAKIHPCTGCVHCGYEGPCAQKDEMETIRPMILEADMLVFATPLYYYGMSAQLKALIDRFCSFNGSIQRKHMHSALLAVAWNSDDWTFEALESHYHTLVRYLNFRDQGMILGKGCGTPSMTQHSNYLVMAYPLGKGLKD
ncbi:MAG TPA: flavodoxin family protein [Candidatus Hungatella pullicola]|nr:flavodoxin family protein [Candidatus Hungatella pullicola]